MSTGADARHVRESVRGCAVALEARRSARASVPHPRLLRGKSKPPAHRKPLVFANPSSTDFIYRLRTHTYKMSCHAGGRFRGFLARTCSQFARTSRHDTSSRPFLRLVTSTRSPRMRRSRRPSTLPPARARFAPPARLSHLPVGVVPRRARARAASSSAVRLVASASAAVSAAAAASNLARRSRTSASSATVRARMSAPSATRRVRIAVVSLRSIRRA